MTTHQIIALAAVALIAYRMGKGASPVLTQSTGTTNSGGQGTGNAAGPEWWSYAGSWRA